jgi:hypothetical protein
MQVYVLTSAISANADTPVIATYEDGVAVPAGAHPNTTMLPIKNPAYVVSRGGPKVLDPGWRNELNDIINGEAARRINMCFPEYAQRNATQSTQDCMREYGIDESQWPAAALANQQEADRGWSYADAVRAASNNLQTSAPLNPVDDSHWPAPIPPIQLQVLTF